MDKSQHRMRTMFNRIAKRYDLMNDIMTFLSHRSTRKKAVALLNNDIGQKALDVATGTGDFAFELCKRGYGHNLVAGVDISANMLNIANYRAKQNRLQRKIFFHLADVNKLPFKDNTFHVCTIGYGIRNVSDPITTLKEIARVTKKGGKLLIVEATPPPNPVIRRLYIFYFTIIVPIVAKFLASDESAYYYLGKSISKFPDAPSFAKMIQQSNWREVKYNPLLLGMVTIFIAEK